ncbi:hypothetical protein HUU40_09430 [candidate division KSB1 bacterium]|nr:hypothetical protein [candidate division KSB1 bacterium]
MAKKKNRQFGGLPPRYSFMLNPYPSERLSRCPLCEQKSRQRKLPLLIHIDPGQLIALNYTCRYCPACDLLVAHKHEIEHILTGLFRNVAPGMIGNDYLIIGTVEKRVWREGLEQPGTFDKMLPHVSDFANYYSELRQTRPGYYRVDQEPLTMEPPPSQEWVKS